MIRVSYYISKLVLWLTFRFYCGLEVTGQRHLPTRGPFILASNHVSFLDPPLLGAVSPRRLRFLARRDLFEHALLGGFMRAVGVIPLARGESDLGAVRKALAILARGGAVAIFPEGTRQQHGELTTAKRGVGLLATLAKAPIVPVYIYGTHLALPPESKRLHRAKIHVAFGDPISYTSASSSSKASTDPGRAGREEGNPARQQHETLAAAVTQAWRRLEAQVKGHTLGPS